MRSAIASFVIVLSLTGCRSREQTATVQQAQPSAGESTAGTPSATTPAASAPSTADRTPAMNPPAAAAGPSAASMVGSWDIAPAAPARGPHLSLAIDSARGSDFFGRLTRALSGDMEVSGNYRPFKGSLGPDGVARAQIEGAEKDVSPIAIAGTFTERTGTITSLVWGEELVTQKTVWGARRTP